MPGAGLAPIVVASSAVPFASTVPSATICVPTGSAAFSPSLYVVLALTTMLRVKPSRSLIVTVVPATAVTAPSRCGLWVRILGTPPVAVDGAPAPLSAPRVTSARLSR